MSKVVFEGQEYLSKPGESVLHCLTRHGVAVNYSCGAGVCQTCMMVAVEGQPTATSQAGLKETLKAQNYFLICSCVPEDDITLGRPASSGLYYDAEVASVESLSDDVIRLCLLRPDDYNYMPGQFLNLFNNRGTSRSYSLASLPDVDDVLELHIREIPGGQVSSWVRTLQSGTSVKISAANGTCAYLPGRPEQPLLLVGTGTGLAPLMGIVRDALSQGHTGPIHLYHGSSYGAGLYLVDALSGFAQQHPNLHYYPCVSREPETQELRSGRATDIALEDFPNLSGWRVFLCGNEAMVKAMQRRVFLAEASMQDIFADPFRKPLESESVKDRAAVAG